jgi:hypothetical protein
VVFALLLMADRRVKTVRIIAMLSLMLVVIVLSAVLLPDSIRSRVFGYEAYGDNTAPACGPMASSPSCVPRCSGRGTTRARTSA